MELANPPSIQPTAALCDCKTGFRAFTGWFVRYPERNMAIDFLRGLSILAVIFSHFNAAGPFAPSAVIPFGFLEGVRANGGLGVSVFFVISGFLITRNSLERFGSLGRTHVGDFYIFRISRILPVLLLLVAVNLVGAAFVLWGFVIPPSVPIPKLLGYVFTFRFNLFYLEGPGGLLTAWAPLWSLAIEEVFYLCFPIIAVVLRRSWLLVPALLALALYGPYYRHNWGWGAFYLYWGCFDLLALGCLTALAAQHFNFPRRPIRVLRALQGGGMAILVVAFFAWDIHATQNWVWLPVAMAVGTALFLLGSSSAATAQPPGFSSRLAWPVSVAGFLSYELYLFHLPVLLLSKTPVKLLTAALHRLLPDDLVFLPFIVILVILMGLLHTWFSEPSLRFVRRHFSPARATRDPAASL